MIQKLENERISKTRFEHEPNEYIPVYTLYNFIKLYILQQYNIYLQYT